jgi:Domain of unknown function (DUF4157)
MSAALHAPVKAAPVPKPALTPARGHVLQRKCACGTSPQGKCEKCNDEGKTLQRYAANHQNAPQSVPPVVHDVLRSSGRPLDRPTRSFMESRFGSDFSGVRVHDDARAAESARAVNARAYTVGQHIAFDRGQYAPHTESGRHLLAHELAHTVQQGGVHRYANNLPLGGAMESHLEREADSVARAVVRPSIAGPITPVTSHIATPIVSRAEGDAPTPKSAGDDGGEEVMREWKEVKVADPLSKIATHQSQLKPGKISSDIRGYKIKEPFPLPAFKGPVAKLWQQRAGAGALESVIDISGTPRAVLKQERPSTDELRRIWLARVGWTKDSAANNWQAAGGDNLTTFEPKAGSKTCEMDHVIELQIGGNNTTENILPLDRDENGASGREIFKYLKDKAEQIRSLTNVKQILLHFDQVTQASPTCNVCCQIAQKADSMAQAAGEAKAKAGVEEFEPYEIKAGVSTQLQLPLGTSAKRKSKPKIPIADSDNVKNAASSTLIPGMILDTLHLQEKGNDSIDAYIDTKNEKTRLPITIDDVKGKERTVSLVVTETRDLKLDRKSEHPKIAFTFPYLSKGTITSLTYDPSVGLSGTGKIKPSIPLLNKMELGVSFTPSEFKLTVAIDPNQITPPFPGLKLTKPELALVLKPFQVSGGFGYELSKGSKKIVYGNVEIKTDGSGIVATGSIKASIPGVDEEKSKGEVTYKDGQWSGVIHIESTEIKLPGIKKGRVDAGFNNKGITGGGELDLEIPGGHTATVGLKYVGDHWEFRGKGVFKIPKLDDTTVYISFDGEKFYGQGNTGFKFHGIKGKFKVKYAAKAGAEKPRIWGEGSLEFTKGRAKGSLAVKMNEKGEFSGSGSVSFTLKEGIVAAGTIIIDEKEKVTVVGSLLFPPYTVFKKFPEPAPRIDILPQKDFDFPIPGASIGPIGLKARISAGIYASYSIGPGIITNGFIKTKFNPLEENPDLDIEAGGKIQVSAEASLTGYLCGSLVVDALLAEVGGGIGVSATGKLKGFVASDLKARYYQGKFEASADLEMGIKLTVTFDFFAYAWASAGVWRFKVTTGKTWDLGIFTYDPGLQLGMKLLKPLSYSSDRGFDVPALDDIKWVTPTFDPEKALTSGFGRGGGPETEGKPRGRPCAKD